MANANATSPAQHPRGPTAGELAELAAWLQAAGHEADVADGIAQTACVAVFDGYCTDCPGYRGKVMSVIWSGSPTFFDVFTWNGGKFKRSGRDCDPHECSRCGSNDGTLCRQCWRAQNAS